MIVGTGVDLVELARMEKLLNQQPKFSQRVLTIEEQTQLGALGKRRQVEYLAGRYACKEAFAKALGTGIGPVSFQEIEILSQPNGAPKVTRAPFSGAIHVSISHTETMAIAQIILEK